MLTITVVETDIYKAGTARLLTENEREGVRGFVAGLPEAGDVIPGLDGLRKMRWTQQQRNKGKRGGTQIVYFWATLDRIIVLLAVYSKDEKEDLSNADRKELKAALTEIKTELAKSRNNQARQKPGNRHQASHRSR